MITITNFHLTKMSSAHGVWPCLGCNILHFTATYSTLTYRTWQWAIKYISVSSRRTFSFFHSMLDEWGYILNQLASYWSICQYPNNVPHYIFIATCMLHVHQYRCICQSNSIDVSYRPICHKLCSTMEPAFSGPLLRLLQRHRVVFYNGLKLIWTNVGRGYHSTILTTSACFVNWTLRNTLWWKFDKNHNFSCKNMEVIMSSAQCLWLCLDCNILHFTATYCTLTYRTLQWAIRYIFVSFRCT